MAWIDREKILKHIEETYEQIPLAIEDRQLVAAFKAYIKNAPTADVVEVVRCKNCQNCVVEHTLDNFLNVVKEFDLKYTQIFLGHPDDLLKMDMKQITCDCCFISDFNVKQGELLMIKEGKLKEELYDFIRINPDRVFKGEKDFKERENGRTKDRN